MNDIGQKALELVNEHSIYKDYNFEAVGTHVAFIALCRAIEQHEGFRQEVSDAVVDAVAMIENEEPYNASDLLSRFIIAKPDPLVEVLAECEFTYFKDSGHKLRAALAKRGLEIREKGDG